MSAYTWLDHVPIWLMFLGVIALALASIEAGHRIGRRRRLLADREKEGSVGTVASAQLGLLALLLAFTFGFAANRFDDRRRAIMDESNAVGTCFLRAAMLPEPHMPEVRRLLREYVDVRIAVAANPSELESAVRRSLDIHNELWRHAVAVAAKDARSIPAGLFTESLNEVIDLHAKRLAAGARTRLPGVVWAVLFTLVAFSFSAIGYQAGIADSTKSPVVFVVAVAFALTVWLVIDLERPQQGVLRPSQQPMIDLKASITEP